MVRTGVLREVKLILPMLPDMEIAASKTATAMAEFVGMTPDKIDEVRMAVMEACINSFEHSQAEDHQVQIVFTVLGDSDPERLEVTVRDNGVGFTPSEVEEPTIEKKLKSARKRGWGLKIIQGLMDEVEFHSDEEGTTVVMCKYRDAGDMGR